MKREAWLAAAAAVVAVASLIPPAPAPIAPVRIDAPCRAERVVIDFPVYGGEYFRRTETPCVWI